MPSRSATGAANRQRYRQLLYGSSGLLAPIEVRDKNTLDVPRDAANGLLRPPDFTASVQHAGQALRRVGTAEALPMKAKLDVKTTLVCRRNRATTSSRSCYSRIRDRIGNVGTVERIRSNSPRGLHYQGRTLQPAASWSEDASCAAQPAASPIGTWVPRRMRLVCGAIRQSNHASRAACCAARRGIRALGIKIRSVIIP